MPHRHERSVTVEVPDASLPGCLTLPPEAVGLVVFVHGSGSSRHSSRNRQVAHALVRRGFATLLFDLLTEDEDRDHAARFDIPLLTQRLLDATAWAHNRPALKTLPLGYFGASTGAAAALRSAALPDADVRAVVSRGGRPDLAQDSLSRVIAPTLLIVGGADTEVLALNRQAYAQLPSPKELAVVAGATHLFEEPGALDQVARLAGDWFQRHCARVHEAA
ncbi:MAG: dienelactone hydrolase family protein [Gammaproteobacteria bacterium]